MAEPTQLDPVVVTAPPEPKDTASMPNFQQMLIDRLNRPLAGGGGDPQQALKDTIAGKQAESNLAMENAKRKEATMRPLQEAKVARIGQTEEQQAGISKELNTPFQVPQETVADFSALGGLVGIMGVMLGTSGKMSAQNVLNSATGILDGYKKGRADVIAQKQKEFEANMKRLNALSSQIQNELKTYMDKAAVKDQTAQLSLDAAAAEGANGIVAAVVKGQSAFEIQKMNQSLANSSRAAQNHVDTILMQLAKDQESRNQQEQTRLRQRELLRLEDGSLVLYDKSSNTYEAAPEELTKAAKLGAGGKGAAGAGDRFGFGNIVAVNLNEAVGSITNIVNLPFKVTTGAFQGRNTSGLLDAPLGALTNNLTKEDVQRYNAEISNFGKFASRVVSGGRVVPASVQQGFEEQYKIREGDKPLTVLTKIAMMRQTLERAAQVYLADPNTPEGTKEIYRQGLKDIEEFIPFTVNDVNKFANQRDNKVTFTQVFPQYGFGGEKPPSAQSGAGAATKTMPTDERLNAYVAAHPEFGGDINKAKEFLRSQGYK